MRGSPLGVPGLVRCEVTQALRKGALVLALGLGFAAPLGCGASASGRRVARLEARIEVLEAQARERTERELKLREELGVLRERLRVVQTGQQSADPVAEGEGAQDDQTAGGDLAANPYQPRLAPKPPAPPPPRLPPADEILTP